jgi:hypothetical protein
VQRTFTAIGVAAVLVLGFDFVTYAATGSSLILGHRNTEGASTWVTNTGAGPAMVLRVKSAATAPLSTNRRGRVANLNSQLLGGRTLTQTEAGATALNGRSAAQIQSAAVSAAVSTVDGQAAFGHISDVGAVTRSSRNVTVTHPTTGIYCIAIPGMSPLFQTATVSMDYMGDSTTLNTSPAEVALGGIASGTGPCPDSSFAVSTYILHGAQTTPTPLNSVANAANQAVYFAVAH